MDVVAREGLHGLFYPIPEDLPAGSDVGNLSLFGYDPHTTFTGRAPLEAAKQGIPVAGDDVAFRCNLVTLADGTMKSFTSGHIPTEEADVLIRALNEALSDLPVSFYTGVSYRHLAIIRPDSEVAAVLPTTMCTPPHDISDQTYEPHLPSGPGAELVRAIMERSQSLLKDHPLNARRIASGALPATSAWLWGQGKSPSMDTYDTRFQLTGTVISAVDLVKGIGVCAGLDVADVPGATGYLDTDYAGKVDAAKRALETQDFVYLHVEAPDETSHEGRTDLKIQAIEDFDRNVVAPCLDHLKKGGPFRLMVVPDHVTAISTKTHAGGPVPFAVCGEGVSGDGPGGGGETIVSGYSERDAAATGVVLLEGHRLLPAVFRASPFTADTLTAMSA
jgi:2,3-bisphosphoglycerate-independent phosphoglycerate mutase